MGLDFIRRCAPSFKKGWNHGKHDLAMPTLFTRAPGSRARSIVAHCDSMQAVVRGGEVTVACEGDSLVMLKGTQCIGRSEGVPPEIHKAISDAGGFAVGKIGDIHPISETIDVELP